MAAIDFCKFHGFGNDYIVFENEDLSEVENLNDFAVKVCHRNTGIGGDGIAVLRKLNAEADFDCRIVNPDGSEAGFSGNGTRCAVAYLYYKNLWSAENLKLQTKSGIKNYKLLEREDTTFWFLAELGKPQFGLPGEPEKIFHPETGEELEKAKFSNLILPSKNTVLQFVYVNVGNPVAVFFVEDFDAADWRVVGRATEANLAIFPDMTNIVLVKTIYLENN